MQPDWRQRSHGGFHSVTPGDAAGVGVRVGGIAMAREGPGDGERAASAALSSRAGGNDGMG